MNYNEHYVIRYRTRDGDEGEFGPFLCEEDAMQQMRKIQNSHDHVRHITWAHLHRKMDATIASWAGS